MSNDHSDSSDQVRKGQEAEPETWNKLVGQANLDPVKDRQMRPHESHESHESFAPANLSSLSSLSSIHDSARAYLSNRFKDLDLSGSKLSKLPLQRNIEKQGSQLSAAASTKEFTLMSAAERQAATFFPIGLKEGFKLQKADLGKGDGQDEQQRLDNFKQFKPRLQELLDALSDPDLARLSAAERKSLSATKEKLQHCDNLNDALSNALHLARLYQHLQYIEEAKKSTLFALGIDPDNLLGRQLFKELERVHPVDLGISHVVTESAIFTKSALRNRIINLSGGKVVVVGDLLIDELVEGRPERISREAPVLILEHVETELIPGGAANTAHNITALGGKCHAIGVCGKDEYGPKLARVLERHGITHALVEDESRPTTVKSRVISKSHSLLQQLLRIDRISHALSTPCD